MTSAGMFFAGRPKEGLPGIFALSRAQSGSNRDGSVHENVWKSFSQVQAISNRSLVPHKRDISEAKQGRHCWLQRGWPLRPACGAGSCNSKHDGRKWMACNIEFIESHNEVFALNELPHFVDFAHWHTGSFMQMSCVLSSRLGMLYLCAGPAPQFSAHAGSWKALGSKRSDQDGDSTLFIADGGRGAVAASISTEKCSARLILQLLQLQGHQWLSATQVVALPSATASQHDVVGASVWRAEACSHSILLHVEARLVAAWCIDVWRKKLQMLVACVALPCFPCHIQEPRPGFCRAAKERK